MPILHSKQAVIKLLGLLLPPFDRGTMWSICNIAPSWGVLPQYWHVNPSLSRILNLILKCGTLSFECNGNFVRGCKYPGRFGFQGWFGPALPRDTKGRYAFSIASAKVPKWSRYAFLEGKPERFSMFRWLGLWPNNLEASTNLDKRYSSVNIGLFYRGLFNKSMDLLRKLTWTTRPFFCASMNTGLCRRIMGQ